MTTSIAGRFCHLTCRDVSMVADPLLKIFFGFLIILSAVVIYLRVRRGSVLVAWGESRRARRFSEEVLASGLVRYKATSRFETLVQDLVDAMLSRGRTVLLVASPPRAAAYQSRFSQAHKTGSLVLVKLSASSRTDRFYLTSQGEKNKALAGKVAEISVDWLEYLSEVIEGLSPGSAVVFEPLTDLILMNGFEKTFKFIKKTVDYCVSHDIKMISFINDEAHDESVKAGFEGLFTNIASIGRDGIELIK